MTVKRILLGIMVLSCANALAQEAVPEITADGEEAPENARFGLPTERIAPKVAAARFYLPPTVIPPNLDELYAQAGFPPSGYVAPAPPGLLERARWSHTPDGGLVCALELYSKDARALRVRFLGKFPRDLQLRVYDPYGGYAFGPVNQPPLNDDGDYWTTIIFGDAIGLEFYVPHEGQLPARMPEITAIAYFFEGGETILNDFAPAGACSLRDASCETRVASHTGAVTMLSVISGGSVVGFCSGALLNRNPSDPGMNSPIVMTANHCVSTQSRASDTVLVWQFKTPSCNGTPPDPNSLPRSNGTVLLKRKSSADWTLLGAAEPVGGAFFLGWNSGVWLPGGEATGLHHPRGTFMRVSEGNVIAPFFGSYCDNNNNCFTADVWIVRFSDGTETRPGSSGSPIMDADLKVRGTLTGGPSNDCPRSDYGRFDLAFENLRYYLFEMASPTFVDRSASSDPGNNGNTERGTSSQPFNQVREATYCVPTGGTVRIAPGNYNERFTIFRAMTLRRDGSSGTVTIGAP